MTTWCRILTVLNDTDSYGEYKVLSSMYKITHTGVCFIHNIGDCDMNVDILISQ